jgi:hypothetical protein
VCLWSYVYEATCKEVTRNEVAPGRQAAPRLQQIICQKIDALFGPGRYVRSMFPKRAGRKLAAYIAERSRGWIEVFEAYPTLEERIEEGLRWPSYVLFGEGDTAPIVHEVPEGG